MTDEEMKDHLVTLMVHFDEPKRYKPNRYDNWIENSSALTEAINAFEVKYLSTGQTPLLQSETGTVNSNQSLSDIFRIAEEQYKILSSFESNDFQNEINMLLSNQGKWEMVNGRIVRSEQREGNRITEVTRQEIIDYINIGLQGSDASEYERFCWNGRLDETNFLGRLFDLTKLRSTDSRFINAEGDIWQHRVNNSDWDDDWVFYDSRFALKIGKDANFLKFLCEMLHPAVRDERQNWKRLLEQINKLLRIDGYELYEKTQMSGKSVYDWRGLSNRNIVIENQTEDLVQKFGTDYIRTQIDAMNTAIDTNPYDAIGKSKELLETCCKTILRSMGESVNAKWDVIKLTKETCTLLKLTPEDIDDKSKASDTIKKLLGNLSVISQSMAELRNSYGSGHGKDAKFKGLTPRHARLAVGAGVTVVHFLWETFEEKHKKSMQAETHP